MNDIRTVGGDDAPLTTAKSRAGQHAAGDALIEVKGDSIVARSVIIDRPRDELYAYWRDFSRLGTFMDNVVRVDVLDDRRSHWVVKAPGGGTVEWDARITDERRGELIAWTAEDGADVPNSGRVEFRDGGKHGTIVTATIAYEPPAGVIGRLVAKMFQREPAIQARRDLRRFKQLMETGEVATSARTRAQYEEEQG